MNVLHVESMRRNVKDQTKDIADDAAVKLDILGIWYRTHDRTQPNRINYPGLIITGKK